MTVSYTLPRLEGDQYARFVDLALRHAARWGIAYTSDGTVLLFTAEHARHHFGLACRDLDTFAVLLDSADRHLRHLPSGGCAHGRHAARDREHAQRERRDLTALANPAPCGEPPPASVAPPRRPHAPPDTGPAASP